MKYIYSPNLDRLIVAPIQEENTGNLIIPDSAKEKPQMGTVIAIGPGKKDEPTIAKKGDTVLYRRGAGLPLPNTDGWLIMREGIDTLAIVTVEAD